MRVERGRDEAIRRDARTVREAVFVEEQGIDPDVEYDEHDADALHLVGYEDDDPVATARLRAYDEDTAKVERVAVLPAYRGEGRGRRMMAAAHDAARADGYERVRIHGQTRVREFYERLGYEATGERFEEANIPHLAMVYDL